MVIIRQFPHGSIETMYNTQFIKGPKKKARQSACASEIGVPRGQFILRCATVDKFEPYLYYLLSNYYRIKSNLQAHWHHFKFQPKFKMKWNKEKSDFKKMFAQLGLCDIV
ncbi:hypothetical protein ACTA71_003325 [Dictyostelium dimigraforme]